jgi:hypothetical protein
MAMNIELNTACGEGDLARARAALRGGDELWVAWAMAGQAGHAELIRWLAEQVTSEADRRRGLHEALKLAAQQGHLAAVHALLAAGAAPPQRPTRGGLHAAAQNGHREIVVALLDAGWPVDALDEDDSTPLAEAVLAERLAVVELLLERGADASHADALGNSPIGLARAHGSGSLAARLAARRPGRGG